MRAATGKRRLSATKELVTSGATTAMTSKTPTLPPFHSILSLDTAATPAVAGSVATDFNFGSSNFSNSASGFYRELYPAAFGNNHWDPSTTAGEQQQNMVAPTNNGTLTGGNHLVNPTDEFLFTAQQMAAHLFDQCHNFGASVDPMLLSTPSAHHLQQQQQECVFYPTPEDVSQLFYNSLGVAAPIGNQQVSGVHHNNNNYHLHQTSPPELVAPMRGGDFQWPDVASMMVGQNNNQNSNSGDYDSDKSASSSYKPPSSSNVDPFDSINIIPIPPGDECQPLSSRETVFMLPPPINYRRRNERERERVRCVNDGYQRLREIIPSLRTRPKRISKVETLRAASRYIRSLVDALSASSSHTG